MTTDYEKTKETLANKFASKEETKETTDAEFFEQTSALTKDLPVRQMRLQYQRFRWGFSYFIGLLDYSPSTSTSIYNMNWVAVSHRDGMLFLFALENFKGKEIRWPLKDRQGVWFVPKITEIETLDPPSGSMPTDEHIETLIRWKDTNKLEALRPYEQQIKACNESTYVRWKSLV